MKKVFNNILKSHQNVQKPVSQSPIKRQVQQTLNESKFLPISHRDRDLENLVKVMSEEKPMGVEKSRSTQKLQELVNRANNNLM